MTTTEIHRANCAARLLRIDGPTLQKMHADFLKEMQKGLDMHKADPTRWHPKQCNLMFLDCCLDKLPTGQETGIFYALDFGGTNVRILRASITHGQQMEITQKSYNIRELSKTPSLPKGVLDKAATATMLFDVVARIVSEFMDEEGDLVSSAQRQLLPLGLTFSFGITQPAIDSAMLYQWAKGFETGFETTDPVVGRDVCALLREAFERNQVPVQLMGAINDTTGTMIAAAMEKPVDYPPVAIGLIDGTGVNACYVESKASLYNYAGRIINTEAGGYKRLLPRTSVDVQLDEESPCRGAQQLEKLVSGHYMPEIIRLNMVRIFQHKAPSKVWTPFSLTTKDSAAIYAADDHVVVRQVLDRTWGWSEDDQTVVPIMKQVCDLVWNRSAALCAVVIASLAIKSGKLGTGRTGLTVGVDGSVFVKNPKYQAAVRDALDSILGPGQASQVYFFIAKDGSGKGAAFLAATLSHNGGRH